MREMKDSGIEWIGEIPKEWKLRKIKFLPNNEENSFVDGDWIESPVITDEGIRYYTTGNIGDGLFKEQGNGYISLNTFKMLNCKYAYPGDLVISRLNAPYGRSCILPNNEEKYVLAVDNVILRTNEDKRFICYLTQCLGYQRAVEDISNGTTMKRVSRVKLGNISLPLPCIDLQNKIANYLDTKCSEIDATSEDIQKEISLLEDYKKSVITEAVTKGLNPDAEMKDSGSEWIGEIPKHWEIIRIGYILGEIDRRSITGMEESLSVSQVLGVVPSSQIAVPSTASTMVGQKIVEPGELVLNKLKAHLGVCFVSNYKGLVSPDYAVYKANEKVKSKLLEYIFHTASCIWEFKKYITGVGQGLSRLYTKDLFRINVALPDMLEQQQIVSYLDSKCSEIDSLIADKKRQLDILADYKKSLIYEYVTGKKEVPVKDF